MALHAYGPRRTRKVLKKLRMIKLTIICTVLICFGATATGFAQKVTLLEKNARLEKVFREINRQTGYEFLYTYEMLEKSKQVTITVKNADLPRVLEIIFRKQPLTWKIIEKTVVIKPKPQENKEEKRAPSFAPPVAGRVTDTGGKPLAGASVMVKGTSFTVTSNAEGQFAIPANKGETLIISFVGFETRERIVLADNVGVISLDLAHENMQEVVVVNKGYYTESRRASTGSVGRVGAADIAKQPVGNPLQAIYGRIPGVIISQQSGMPGGSINIQIRGQNSLRNTIRDNGNYPLYIIDGVPYFSTPLTTSAGINLYPQGNYARGESPFNSLNPADIESIEILKDADATAIYGSRGANGVILITTKKGRSGKMKVDASFYTGAGAITRKMKLLNTQQYLEMRKEAFKNDGITTYNNYDYDVNGTWSENNQHNWQEELMGGTATSTDAQVSVSGGNNLSQYRLGGGYHRETTVLPGDFSNQRGSGHLSLSNSSPNNKFKSQVSVNYSVGLSNFQSQDLMPMALSMAPNMPDMIDEKGNLVWGTGVFSNPYAVMKQPYKLKSSNIIGNVTLSYELWSGLFIKTNAGYTATTYKELQKIPLSTQAPVFQPFYTNTSIFGNSTSNSWIIEPQLNYLHSFDKHQFNALVGTTFQNEERDQLAQTANGFSSEALMDNIAAVPNANVFNNYYYYKYRYNAVFGRLNYTYSGKYILNLTGRRDGSSRFGPGKQFANFGSVGAAWIFSDEAFVRKALPFLNYGKLRSSYGTTGSDQIPDYGFLDTYSSTGGGQYQGVSGLAPIRLFNPDFQWEINKKFEVALELGFLQDRLHLTTAYFRNRSSNQLVGYTLPPTTGFPSIQYNLPAVVQNTGLEVELQAGIFREKNFKWTSAFNITIPRNKLIAYPDLEGSSYANFYVVGQPLSIARRFKYLGVDPETGLYTIEDVNKDNLYNVNDYASNAFIGQRFYGGWQNTLSFRRFTLDFLFQFVKQNAMNYLSTFLNAPGMPGNQPVEVMNRWREKGDVAPVQKFTTMYSPSYNSIIASDATASDASFIRLKNISLSYRLPDAVINRIGLKDVRLYVQGQNLITITSYRGLDPETLGTAMPPLKMLTGGLQLSL